MSPQPGVSGLSARRCGYMTCPACGLLCRQGDTDGARHCPRCFAPVHVRKPNSVARTWAYLIAAAIMYIPANLLPIMETRSLFGVQGDTIMSGVIFLWLSGSWPLAVLVFFASVMIPLLKLLVLGTLVISVQRRSRWAPVQRARLYRFVEFVGRWSMLDIYVLALLVALVQLQSLATVRAGNGSVAFGAVVVLTMLAARSFDPRLIWDPIDDDQG